MVYLYIKKYPFIKNGEIFLENLEKILNKSNSKVRYLNYINILSKIEVSRDCLNILIISL